jgi:hypothetical protein
VERLIVCQGTAQLVTAVAALHLHTGEGSGSMQSQDHLLICGLAVSQSQAQAFATVIERMAALLHPFTTISHLDDIEVGNLLAKSRRASTASELAVLLQQAIGIGTIGEVFTVRDWQPCNVLVLNAFPDATHVLYGDSVGVYLPRGFMAGRSTIRSWLASLLRGIRLPGQALRSNPRLDVSYLLLPDAFGVPPGGRVVRTDAVALRDLFIRLGPLIDGSALDNLRRRTSGRPLWVLMGSNFSEQGMMTPLGEMAAYREWIAALRPEPGTVLLIKSHPRDGEDKHERLERGLRDLFDEVLSADLVGSSYLPMETLLLDLMPRVASLLCLTVSTACLATNFVVGSRTQIGIGDELVEKYVAADRRRERSRHEADLRRICSA